MSTKVKFPCIVFLKHRTLDFINYEVYLESESDDCWYGFDDVHKYGSLTGYPKESFVIASVVQR